ncbi:hypothetical protein ETC04_16610, partial [Geobacillus sp. MR]|nr:hypothetical protein [Geobacillus sp. MR]
MPLSPSVSRAGRRFVCLVTVELGIYFDTTSSYFEVDPSETPEGESLRKQGFSKDKRPDLVQIVIG